MYRQGGRLLEQCRSAIGNVPDDGRGRAAIAWRLAKWRGASAGCSRGTGDLVENRSPATALMGMIIRYPRNSDIIVS